MGLPNQLLGDVSSRSQYKKEVFISYAWNQASDAVADALDKELQTRGTTVVRDKRGTVGYRGALIIEFMKRMGPGRAIVVILSDKYLRSPSTMLEFIEICKHPQYYDHVFPIILADANIYEPVKRLDYVKYWEDKKNELAEATKSVNSANVKGVQEDIEIYDAAPSLIDRLFDILKEMNSPIYGLDDVDNFNRFLSNIDERQRLDDLEALQPSRVKGTPTKKRRQSKGRQIPARQTISSSGIEHVTNLLSENNKIQTEESAENPTSITDALQTDDQRASALEANLLANNRSQPVLNDQARGEDQLGIKDEVEALAETLLLRDVEPPVAVGVMGGWGSGKSFVMYLISKYVEQTRCRIVKQGWSTQEKDQNVPVYVGHVYQISFNAWTYAKSNLWASLMDTIFINLNRQMQIEQLLAHRDCSPESTTNLADDVRRSMLAGGNVFTKIYGESLKFDQDKELEECRDNLGYWAHHLFKGNLLWSVMRRRQEQNLDRLKDTEEQLKQLKSGREEFEKSRSPEKKSVTLDASTAKACAQTMLTSLVAFIPDQVSTTAVQSLQKQDVTEEDINQALKETWEVKGLIDTIFATFREYRLLRLLTFLFLLLGIILLILPVFDVDFIQRKMAVVTSFIVTALPFVSASLYWWQKVASFNAKAKVILEDAYKNQQAKQAEEIANSTKKSPAQKITDLQKEVSQGSLAAYDTLINLLEAQAEAERQLIGPSAKYSSLMEFVQSRLDAATYENQLGLMHQVRQDIDELTYSLADGAREDVFPRGKPRVILYIDDLDRCPPARVVEILEAVQLLLNTKLFVIILGLDTRYVTRALEKEYKEILQHEGDPSGLDYIEKIIQIPYRVRPIERDSLQKYLAMQMDVEKPPEPEPEPVVQTPAQDQPASMNVPLPSSPPAGSEPHVDSAISTRASNEQPAPEASGTEPAKAPDVRAPELEQPKLLEVELPPAVIQFKQEDLLDLTACCQQIPLSPRSIKRLVNVFKLIKIFWFRADKDADIAGRDQPRPVKQAAMCMLALSSAYPEVMREVFVHLEGLYRQGKEQSQLFNELNSIKLPPGSAHDLAWQLQKYKSDVSTLKMMAGNEQDKLSQLTLKDFQLSTFNIVRSFSFVGDPMYWTDGEDDTVRTNGKSEAKSAARTKKKTALP